VRRLILILFVLVGLFVGLVAAAQMGLGPVVITKEGEQKLILLLGDVRTTTGPGISLRLPFIEDVQTYDARWLYLSAEALPIQTKDGEQLTIDNYVIWRIVDPEAFLRAFPGGRRDAEQRIDRSVRDDVREVIGRYALTDVLKNKRDAIMKEITAQSRLQIEDNGIEIRDVRINRTELPEGTEDSVYARMNAERERLAKKNRAEGEERARRIRAESERDARVIVAEGNRDAEIARGEGDAEATRIYAAAYNADPDFYEFTRSLEAYRKTIGNRTTLVLSPDTEFFQFIRSRNGSGDGKAAGE